MDDTRRSRPAEAERAARGTKDGASPADGFPRGPAAAVRAALASALRAAGPDRAPVAVALSGGRDSMALLDAAVAVIPRDAVIAIHVHHGLSPNADQWADFCASECARHGVVCVVRKIAVGRVPRRSLEADAREQRRVALAAEAAAHGARAVLVAHHADDQAETLLLQLARGAGPRGLAAMPAARREGGLWWLRPFLDLPRRVIDDYVRARGIAFVDDESNASPVHRRNALRQRVTPSLAAIFPGYPRTLVRAARLQAEAAGLLDELATADAARWFDGTTLDRSAFAALPPPRAANLLRWFLRERGLAAPPEARLREMLDQLSGAGADARVALDHDGRGLGVHRGRIHVHATGEVRYLRRWSGEPVIVLPHGTLALSPALGRGVARRHLAAAPVTIRDGVPGERLKLGGRPRRAVTEILREAAVPAWERPRLPRLYAGETLVAVTTVGVEAAFAAAPGEPAIELDWQASPA